MKDTQYFLFILLVVFISACSSDDDCTAESVAGTYSLQPADCTQEGAEEFDLSDLSLEDLEIVTITVVDENTISLDNGDGTTTELELQGCSIGSSTETADFFGLSVSFGYSGEFDGDQLILELSTNISGEFDGQGPIDVTQNCTFIGAK